MIDTTAIEAAAAALAASDATFRDANLLVGVWDSLQALAEPKKAEHVARINAALSARAGRDYNALSDLNAALGVLRADVDALPAPSGYNASEVDWEHPPHVGDITTPGTVLDRIPIHGKVSIRASDCAIVKCGAEGRYLPSTGTHSVIDASSTSAVRFYIEDTLITVPEPDVRWAEGLRLGPDAIVRRVTVHDTVDGFAWHNKAGGSVLIDADGIEASGLTWSAVDPNHADGTHNDAVQVHSPVAPGSRITRALLDAGPDGTAAIMVNVTSVNGLWVTHSVLRGGRSCINFGPSPYPVAYITHNALESDVGIFASSAAGIVARGNTPSNTITGTGS